MRTAELLDSLKQQEPISLSQILDAKEQRVCRQQEMMSRETGNSPKTLISFTLNIAGAIKSFPLFTQAFVEGKRQILRELSYAGVEILEKREFCGKTGDECYLLVRESPKKIKELMVAIEEGSELGRLFDIDVMSPDIPKISRSDLGLPPRKCLVCGQKAAVCARSRAHSIEEIWARTVEIIPEDGFNLNRHYPGKADGTTGERIAWYFMTEIFPYVDFIFDFHSGSNTEVMTPLVFYTTAPKVRDCTYEAAKALDLPYLVASEATRGQYSYAAHNYDVPGLLVEIEHSHSCKPEWVELYERNLKLLIQHLGIYDFGAKKQEERQKVYREAIYLDAEEKGLWYPAVTAGESFRKGDLLGHMEDFFGKVEKEYFAQKDGTVLYYTDGLAVPKDTFLMALGTEDSGEIL